MRYVILVQSLVNNIGYVPMTQLSPNMHCQEQIYVL
jgi:hypothetical protein